MRHVLNFQAQFAPLVESGEKRQTIRAPRKRQIAVGDELRLYTGMRTKACRLLGVATCTEVEWTIIGRWCGPNRESADAFARADGFADYRAMQAWFDDNHGLPFEGVVIHWGALRKGGG